MSRGFSLVEMLVALAVLSVGLLGAAGMLLGGLRDQALALRHQGAGILVAGIAERIRTNPGARAAYDTRNPRNSGAACDEAAPCDSAALAAHDLTDFDSAAQRALPEFAPRVDIHFEPAIGPAATDRYVISLTWRDARDPEATDAVTLILLAQSPVAGAA